MPLFLGHTTALHLLETKGLERLPRADWVTLDHCVSSKLGLSAFSLGFLEKIPQPYDVLVHAKEEHRTWSLVKCHQIAADLPDGSFVEVAPDVFIASPELCYLQMAKHLTLAQTVALGCNLCGTFAKDSETGRLVERTPLTTPEDLGSYIGRCRHHHALKRARRALQWVLPGSASPMETVTALVYSLPRRLGGFGFARPELNYEVPIKGKAAAMVSKSHIRIDVYWPDKLWGIEYQGRENHSLDGDIGSDIARQLAAEAMHIELQMITASQLRNDAQRIAIAQKTANHLGRRLETSDEFLASNRKLVDELLSRVAPQGNGNLNVRR